MEAKGRITDRGAFVEIIVRNERHWQANGEREALQSGIPAPSPERGLALIDTGASMSMVAPEVLDRLHAMPDKVVRLQGLEPARPWALVGAYECATKFVEIEFVGLSLRLAVSVAAVPFGDAIGSGVIAVIGRDLLDRLIVHYDGQAREVTLTRRPTGGGAAPS